MSTNTTTLAAFTATDFKAGHGKNGQCSLSAEHKDGKKFADSATSATFQRTVEKDGKEKLEALCDDHAIALYTADELAAAVGSVTGEPVVDPEPAADADQVDAETPADEAEQPADETPADEPEPEPEVKTVLVRFAEGVWEAFRNSTAAKTPEVKAILDGAGHRFFGKGKSYHVETSDPQVLATVVAALRSAAAEKLGGRKRDGMAGAFLDRSNVALAQAVVVGYEGDLATTATITDLVAAHEEREAEAKATAEADAAEKEADAEAEATDEVEDDTDDVDTDES